MRILVAEDERDMNRIITRRLAWEGYETVSCYDGAEALSVLASSRFDLIILDVMMPKTDGFEVVERLRARDDETPVLFLTARDTQDDKVAGLDLGGDDYLVKPFEFDELIARIHALLRRSGHLQTSTLRCGDLTLNIARHQVLRGETEIRLTAREFSLLEYMLRNQGNVLSREQIESALWGSDAAGSNVVDVYIRLLRRKIDEDFEPKLIRTVRGYGYVLREAGE